MTAQPFPFPVGSLVRIVQKNKQGTETFTVKVTGAEWKQYRDGAVWGWYFGYVPSDLPDSARCGFGYSWHFPTPMEYGVQSVESVLSAHTLTYVNSEFASTKKRMGGMTAGNLVFVDAVYRRAMELYEQGGDVIVEAYTPWEVLQTFESLSAAEDFIGVRREYESDVCGW